MIEKSAGINLKVKIIQSISHLENIQHKNYSKVA